MSPSLCLIFPTLNAHYSNACYISISDIFVIALFLTVTNQAWWENDYQIKAVRFDLFLVRRSIY